MEWPDAEVRRKDNIPDSQREHWWTVYITNAGIDEVPPGKRRWYNLHLPLEPGIYLGWPPPTRIEFTVAGRRFRLADGTLEEQLRDSSFVRVRFGEPESRELAEQLKVWIGRPDEEVRKVDGLSADENWWVVYLAISGDRPVHRVCVIVSGESRRPWQIRLPPVEPGWRRWWILRPDSGFGPDQQMPRVQAEFDALGYRWRRTGDELERVVSSRKSDARETLETAARQYEIIRDSMQASWDETAAMEKIIANARMYARGGVHERGDQ